MGLEIHDDANVNIDEDQMKQVMINLVKNAMEAAPPETPIRIYTQCNMEKARIIVEDRGPGIPKELLDRIFDLYFTTKNNGAGLGLSIVEKIVQSHGGSIRVESPYSVNEETVQGTRFIIELPINGNEEKQA